MRPLARSVALILVAGAAGALPAWAPAAGVVVSTHARSQACPASLPAVSLSLRPGASLELVPPGVRTLVLCSYHGLNPASEARRLERTRTVAGASVLTQLVSEFNALPPSRGIRHCPMDDGSAVLALFGYPASPPDPVTLDLTGCRNVQNGHLTRTASLAPGPALIARILSLLG